MSSIHKRSALALAIVTPFAAAAVISACGSKDKDSSSAPSAGTEGTTTVSVGKLLTQFKASRLQPSAYVAASNLLLAPGARTTSANSVGATASGDIESLAFRISTVSLCENLVTVGTATSCQGDPLSIYSDPNQKSGDYDAYFSPEARADTTNFTDFMDAEAVKKLSSETTYSSNNVHSYNGVVVYFFRAFKVKATVTLNDGTKLYTKDTGTFDRNGTGLDTTMRSVVTDMTTAPAQTGVFFLPNGGTYFKLQSPFEITADDLANKVNFKVVFAFDPDNSILGRNNFSGEGGGSWLSGMLDKTNQTEISAPFVQFAPVIARENETIMRETYLLRSGEGFGGTGAHDVRLSLYYIKEDTTGGIRAITTTATTNALSTTTGMNFYAPERVVKNASGKLDMLSPQSVKVLKDFERLSTLGQTATVVSQQCADMSGSTPTCPEDQLQTRSYSYTLVSSGELAGTIAAVPAPTATPSPTATP